MIRVLQVRLKVFSERLYLRVLSVGNFSRKRLLLLFSIGLVVRMVGMFGLGDGDMEHFKAWTTLTHTYGVERMYSASDAELIARARERHQSTEDSFNSLRTRVTIQPLDFDRTEYMVAYPPGSVYLLHLSGMAYKVISPEMHNSRLFNAFINFPMLIVSIAITWLIFVFIRRENPKLAVAAALFYWLNPIVLMDSTIQGYNNPLIALVNLLVLICLYRRSYLAAVCLTSLGLLIKPQAILLIPIVAIVCLRETKVRKWPVYLVSGVAVALVFLLPFLMSGYLISSLFGATFALRSLEQVLSPRSWNLWWPLHVVTYNLFGVEMVRLPNFTERFGVDPKIIGSVAMILVCGASLVQLYRKLAEQRLYIFFCMVMFGYAYTMVQVNVQYNQFFVFIPMLLLIALVNQRLFAMTIVLSIPWLIQLFTYGGLGRDFCCPSLVFGWLGLSKVFTGATLLVALVNALLWLLFSWYYFSGWFVAPGNLLWDRSQDFQRPGVG